jgi:hypothetical protein
MSDQIALDLFIQDFVQTNKLLNTHYDWSMMTARRWITDGIPRIFEFKSGDAVQYGKGQLLQLPDADWFRIELTRSIPTTVTEHRFDCLRMMSTGTHATLDVQSQSLGVETNVVLVKLVTRNRGLLNVVFVIRDQVGIENPFLG